MQHLNRILLILSILMSMMVSTVFADEESVPAANSVDATTPATAITEKKVKNASIKKTLSKPATETEDPAHEMKVDIVKHGDNVVNKRIIKEDNLQSNPFAIAFYQPTYVLPYYYTRSPDNRVYANHTPDNESLKRNEVKYQLSFKVPLWKNIFNYPSTLYLAYTQMSYWQAYNHTAFFRETDYEPEVFLANEFNFHLLGDWRLNFFNIGAMHQSNGEGTNLERSWNRVYLKAVASTDNFMISVQPWWIVDDGAYQKYNPNLASYMGYGELVLAYKFKHQVISFQARNFLHYNGRRATGILSYSFPITSYLNGYVQVFSGYGQSLLEYNHRTNSVGIGISLSNFI